MPKDIIKLKAKHRKFADKYFKCGKAGTSYREVYKCGAKTAASAGWKLLKRDDVQAYLAKLHEKKADIVVMDSVISDQEVLEEETNLIRRRIPEMFDENGAMKMIHDWSPELQAALKTVKYDKFKVKKPDGTETYETYIKEVTFEDKGAALGRVEKVKGMVVDRHEHTGEFNVRAILADIDGLNRGKLPQDCN